jgi:PAS domain S-box-containing protein
MRFWPISEQRLSRAMAGGLPGKGRQGRDTLAQPSPLVGYPLAVLLAVLAQIVRIPLHSQTVIPFITYVPFTVLAGWYCGLGPGVVNTVLCLIECDFFAIEPVGQFFITDWQQWVGLLILLLTGLVSSLLFNNFRKARRSDALVRSQADSLRNYMAAIVDSSDDSIVGIDLKGAITTWNRSAERMYGYSAKEAMGQPITFLLTADQEKEELTIQARLWNGESVDHYETRRRRKDGTYVVVSVSASPVKDASGQIVGASKIARDITERKRAAEALLENRLQLGLALRAAHSGDFEWDIRTNEVVWGEEGMAIFGVKPEEFRGRYEDWHDRVNPEDVAAAVDAVQRSVQRGELETEYRIRRKDNGEVRWIATRGTVICNEAGAPQLMVGINMDVTERKQAEKALRESEAQLRLLSSDLERRVQERTAELASANKELESFTYSVSHDLRAPLRGIDGWSCALIDDYGDKLDEQARGYLDRVRAETRRMGQLIDDLLRMSRVTRAEMNRTRVDLSALANSITSRIREANPGRETEFTIEPGLTAEGDPRLLDVAITNLLDNAAKFSSKRVNAKVEFGVVDPTKNDGRKSRFFVRDNGAGFDMAYADQLFGAFQRLHSTSEFPGTGIGLATVQRVIQRHGGTICAESKPGEGATFYFTIGGAN